MRLPSSPTFGRLNFSQLVRKPIYSNLPSVPQPRKSGPPSSDSPSPSPTPTDRLATQIRTGRLFIHAYAKIAEDRTNAFMSNVLKQEQSLTSTIASLAPPLESGERLMPGALYVLVASMAGSIISRNRNILLRATTPAAVGIGAAYVVLPYTMRNVGDLVWAFEEKSEVIASNHLRIRGAAVEAIKEAKITGERTKEWSERIVRDGRELVEGWVRKGM